MRARRAAQDQVAEVARRRLELLGIELAEARGALPRQPDGERASEPASDSPVAPSERPAQSGSWQATGSAINSATGDRSGTQPGRHARRSVGARARASGWLFDRLPPTLQGRVDLAAEHLTVLAVLVAVALGVTAWWVLKADPPGDLAPASAPVRPGPSSVAVVGVGAESPGADASGTPPPNAVSSVAGDPASAVVVVDVAGKVRRPGIAALPIGSRVVDALKAAGGARRGVDLTSLNLARVLVDGEQIVVGVAAPGGVAAPAVSVPGAAQPGSTMINLNTASQAELEELPGIGPVTAGAILQWRTEHGAFTSVDELLEVSGIGDATLAEIAPFVTL